MASAFQANAFQNSGFQTVAVEVPVPIEPPNVSGPPHPPRQIPFEIVNALAKGQILVVRLSLLPGMAFGAAKAAGDAVLVANAVASGAEFDVQRWQMMGGAASSKIVLTEDEEIMLILADAA